MSCRFHLSSFSSKKTSKRDHADTDVGISNGEFAVAAERRQMLIYKRQLKVGGRAS